MLSLHEHRRDARVPLNRHARSEAERPGSVVDWRTQFVSNHQTDRAAKVLVSTLLNTGLESLKSRFGAVP